MNWHKYFTYDAKAGDLIWKERSEKHFKRKKDWIRWNRWMPGVRAGSVGANGYRHVGVRGVYYAVHRIVWEMHHGPIPKGMQIDHMDMVRSNNMITNLRLATRTQNNMNRSVRTDSRVQAKGVFIRKSGSIAARITLDGKYTDLGNFDTVEDAHAAYIKAAIKFYGDFARSK